MALVSQSSGGFERRRTKQGVCDQFLARVGARGDIDVNAPGFIEGIVQHFELLPTRYALDVNINTLDVLSHKRLLDEARSDPKTVSFAVRPVDVLHQLPDSQSAAPGPSSQASPLRSVAARRPMLPKPAFGSSPNLQALAIEAIGDAAPVPAPASPSAADATTPGPTFHEITIATHDQPKLLSRLSDAMGDLGLNIREAHVFNTADGLALDVFVVDGWLEKQQRQVDEGGESMEELLGQRLLRMPPCVGGPGALRLPEEAPLAYPMEVGGVSPRGGSPPMPADWEIDVNQLQIDTKVASGSFSNLYHGVFCGQEVAVKILKDVQDDASQYQEFLQEVSIMRKVRHKNVVQFIGACTRKPNLCILFEYMAGGSLYDHMRKGGALKLGQVLKVAVEVSRGMDYLHQLKIIHRDLKAANLLLDDTGIVKIADFGVARTIESNGVMTAETGTYRWMAPEVIEHRPYDEKADVFSFGVVLWELLTCKIPYADMTPLQAAVSVVQKGLRPPVPPNCPKPLADIMVACWDANPALRPAFRELTPRLQLMLELWRVEDAANEQQQRRAQQAAPQTKGGGLLSKLSSIGGGGGKQRH